MLRLETLKLWHLETLILVGLDRLELSTSPLSGVRSSHLNYRPGYFRFRGHQCRASTQIGAMRQTKATSIAKANSAWRNMNPILAHCSPKTNLVIPSRAKNLLPRQHIAAEILRLRMTALWAITLHSG